MLGDYKNLSSQLVVPSEVHALENPDKSGSSQNPQPTECTESLLAKISEQAAII